MNIKIIPVKTNRDRYPVYVKNGIFKESKHYFKKAGLSEKLPIILTSKKVINIYAAKIKLALSGLPHKIITLSDGENAKSTRQILKTITKIIKIERSQRVFIICLGGGTVGDAGGFIASIYKRGIPYIQIPTTLLSQIDAAIGGKTAINLQEAKNILGTFYQPKAVLIDPLFLKTLPFRQIKNGMAEAIKYGVIKDPVFFDYLYKINIHLKNPDMAVFMKIIEKCARIKSRVVSCDEKEQKGIRTILNFGHTVGHAIETEKRYRILHGEAIALGMLVAAYLSRDMGMCGGEEVEKIKAILIKYKFAVKTSFNPENLMKCLLYDKKFTGKTIRMVLLQRIGKVTVKQNIPESLLKKSLKNIRR